MELKNDIESYAALNFCVDKYYRNKNLPCLPYGAVKIRTTVIEGKVYEEAYEQVYFVARKHFIRYDIPIDRRNFYACLFIGTGPHFVPLGWLLSEASESKLSMSSTTEGVIQNLTLFDEYLAGRLT